MTFLEALKTGRPIRFVNGSYKGPWIFLGEKGVCPIRHPFINIKTGDEVTISSWEYGYTWEAMP